MMKIFALKLDWFLWGNSAQIMRKWTGHVSHLKWVYVVITFMRAEWINLSGRPTQRLLCCYLLSVPSTNIIIPFNRSRWHFRNNIKINTNLPTPRSLHQHRRQNQPHSIRTVGVCMRVCLFVPLIFTSICVDANDELTDVAAACCHCTTTPTENTALFSHSFARSHALWAVRNYLFMSNQCERMQEPSNPIYAIRSMCQRVLWVRQRVVAVSIPKDTGRT